MTLRYVKMVEYNRDAGNTRRRWVEGGLLFEAGSADRQERALPSRLFRVPSSEMFEYLTGKDPNNPDVYSVHQPRRPHQPVFIGYEFEDEAAVQEFVQSDMEQRVQRGGEAVKRAVAQPTRTDGAHADGKANETGALADLGKENATLRAELVVATQRAEAEARARGALEQRLGSLESLVREQAAKAEAAPTGAVHGDKTLADLVGGGDDAEPPAGDQPDEESAKPAKRRRSRAKAKK